MRCRDVKIQEVIVCQYNGIVCTAGQSIPRMTGSAWDAAPDFQIGSRDFSHMRLCSVEGKKPEFSSVSSPETPFVIPRPGEIVSGFFRFTEEVQSGRISQDSFQSRLEEVSELIRSVFSTMYLELGEISEAGKEYGSSVTMLLGVCSLHAECEHTGDDALFH